VSIFPLCISIASPDSKHCITKQGAAHIQGRSRNTYHVVMRDEHEGTFKYWTRLHWWAYRTLDNHVIKNAQLDQYETRSQVRIQNQAFKTYSKSGTALHPTSTW